MIMAMVHGGSLREAAISERPIACCARWPLSVQRLGFAPHNRFGRLAHEVVGNFFAADPPQFYQVPFGCHSIDPIKESLIDAGFNDIRVHVIALEKEISGALKTVLATPATCANSTGNSSASPRRNIPARSGGSICACSILGKGGVWISRSCFGSVDSSILACGNTGRYAEHDQSCRQPRFFSHKETIRARIGHVNRDLADRERRGAAGSAKNSRDFCLARLAFHSALHWTHKFAFTIAPIRCLKVHCGMRRLS
jgi:hypothetical protein